MLTKLCNNYYCIRLTASFPEQPG